MSKIISQPVIPEVFAYEGDTRTIPVTTSEKGRASYSKGYPVETALPKENGGVPPKREDFNQILKVLSEFAYYMQSGGCFTWQADRDYMVNFEIIGSDGKKYRCIQNNGINYGGAKDPVTNRGYWELSTPEYREVYYTGNGTQTDFNFPSIYNIMEVSAYIDGLVQKKAESYILVDAGPNSKIRFTEPVPAGRTIVLQANSTVNVSIPAELSGLMLDIASKQNIVSNAVSNEIAIFDGSTGNTSKSGVLLNDITSSNNLYLSGGAGKIYDAYENKISDVSMIHLAPGAYDGNFAHNKQNVTIAGSGAVANSNSQINGTVTTETVRFRAKNIQFNGGAGEAVIWDDDGGIHNFEGCQILNNASTAALKATAKARGYATFFSCDFSDNYYSPSGANNVVNIELSDLPSGETASITFVSCTGIRISIGEGWRVFTAMCPDIAVIKGSSNVIDADNIFINAILTNQSQLTGLKNDMSTSTDGFYICAFANPSAGNSSNNITAGANDILFKRSGGGKTLIVTHKSFAMAPAAVSVLEPSGIFSYHKSGTGWIRG